MAENAPSSCPACCEPYNDNSRLPLTASCGHTTCTACLRAATLAAHPDAPPGREGTVPSGRKVECQVCEKKVSTDQLVINRAVLAKVPLTLEDLIIPEDTKNDPGTTKHDPGMLDTTTSTDHHVHTTTTTLETPQHHTETQLGWTHPKMDPHHHDHTTTTHTITPPNSPG
ncbi:uncharacterized protein LOC123511645 [Portunus trituberculatus]|uniref:uncharacterized protein LOC123511645 n=1 Tax=Portunus trituberculatus TaxID=210409 RepID=UPI001E1CFE19|nr:uncharacterized protein LOC123511645 [Portunus trituberculatus]